MIRIVTDSTADLTAQEIKDLNIDVVPLNVVFKDRSYLDGVELDPKTFYKLLEEKDYPTTSQPAPSQFYDVFKKYAETDDEIICINISGELSGTAQSAKIAGMDFKNKIEIIDSMTAALPVKLLLYKAVELRDAGKPFEEIISTINSIKDRAVLCAGFDTLEYLVKGGRLSKVAGFAGTLLKIKPIIGVKDGKLEVITKTRGRKQMIQTILEIALSHKIDSDEPLFIGYTKEESGALELKKLLEEKGYKITLVYEIGAVIGVHAGPGAVAIGFFKKHD